MDKLFDLRFVIGLFFFVIGALLTAYYFIFSVTTEAVNLWCGVLFIVFGVIMILLSRKGAAKKLEESVEESISEK